MRVYYDNDADVNLIKTKKVLIVGYGSQGHAHAANLRDSGVNDIAVALREGSSTRAKAEGADFKCMTAAEGAKWADVVMVLVPDELQADLYANDLAPNMKEGASLMFAHGLNVHFKLIEPRADLDVFMIAPKGPGHTVRSEYLKGAGVPTLIAVHQDATGNAWISVFHMVLQTAVAAQGSSKQHLKKSAKLTYSVSKPFFVVVHLRLYNVVLKCWLKRVMPLKWHISNVFMN